MECSTVEPYIYFFRHLSEEGLDIVSENGQIQDVNILTKKALDVSGKCSCICVLSRSTAQLVLGVVI